MAVGDIYMTALHFTYQKNVNLMCNYFQVDEEPSSDDVETDLATFVQDDWDDELRSIFDDKFVVDCSEVRQVHPNNSIPLVTAVLNPTGSRTPGDGLPGQCSLVATLFGNKTDPNAKNRGRDFWTAGQEGDQANGKWRTVPGEFLNLVELYYGARTVLVSPPSGNVFSWGNFSRKAVAVADPIHFWQMELVRIRHLVRTQRRRQPSDPCETYTSVEPVQP